MEEPRLSVPLSATLARALLERHGLPRYRQSAWLANAVGLSYSQAHRRLNGDSPLSLEDLAQLGDLLGESLAEIVAPADAKHAVDATMRVGTEPIPCRLWLGEPIATPTPGSLVAIHASAGWDVIVAGHQHGGEAFEIVRLDARPSPQERRAVAVLDDDRDVTDSIAASFEGLGYRASRFYAIPELLQAASTTAFDCFILDWVIGEGTVSDAVRSLREANRSCPIVILTAQVSTGAVNETDIAKAIKQHDLLFCEKPVRTSILAAMLSRAFAMRTDQPGAAPR